MSGVTLAFESKAPHRTPWLSVEHPVNDVPSGLFDALDELGWKEDERMMRVPPLDGIQEVQIIPPRGTGLFGEWTDGEARHFMPEVRRLLRKQGFDRVPWNRLTLAELL